MIVKPAAMDETVLTGGTVPADHVIADGPRGERRLLPGPEWMRLDPRGLTFAAIRMPAERHHRFYAVLASEPGEDLLVLLPLRDGETPLTVVADPSRWRELAALRGTRPAAAREFSLSRAHHEERFGLPLPVPRRILAVAANFPSHLRHDLGVAEDAAIAALARTRPRVFQKLPRSPVPGTGGGAAEPLPGGWCHPVGSVERVPRIQVPTGPGAPPAEVESAFDYEVEVGAVLGRALTPAVVAHASDDELRAAIAGHVLVGDNKVRNPQMIGKLLGRTAPYPSELADYLTGDEALDRRLGLWRAATCQWWSYAASQGDCTSLGPFLVTPEPGGCDAPVRAVVSARTYAPAERRGAPLPADRAPSTFYLRQCSRVTAHGGPDPMLWDVPAILRSVLSPGSALDLGADPRLEVGDVVALGTPGGVTNTARPRLQQALARSSPDAPARAGHDRYFERYGHLFLRPADELFLWAEGLGHQRLVVA